MVGPLQVFVDSLRLRLFVLPNDVLTFAAACSRCSHYLYWHSG
jgi:hypothetical protein